MTGERIWQRLRARSSRPDQRQTADHYGADRWHGQHVFRAYWKHAWIKQYEKYATYLRNEVTSNNLRDFKLRKGLAYLGAVRTLAIAGARPVCRGQQAENLNVHEDFALLRRIALPVERGSVLQLPVSGFRTRA